MIGFLMEAYDLKPFQISGPDWLSTTKIALTATVPKGATKEDYRLMLRNVLVDRFKMQSHFESRKNDVYVLVVGKDGPKLKESAAEEGPDAAGPPASAAELQKDADGFALYPWRHDVVLTGTINGRSRLRGNHATMAQLIARLKFMVSQPVKDETGLTGAYDFVLTYAPAGPPANAADPSSNAAETEVPPAPDIIGAMPQIGLKLELRKEMVDILAIDHLEKIPTGN